MYLQCTGSVHHPLPPVKAVGIDGIPMELWKGMSSRYDSHEGPGNPHCDIIGALTSVFTDIEKHGIDPTTRFNEGWMCPIYKKGNRNNVAKMQTIR
jgi:hypothetical protein